MSAGAPINEGRERGALSVWRRHIELPRYLRQARGREELRAVLEEVADELGFARLCLASGPTVTRGLASGLARSLDRGVGPPLIVEGNGEQDVERLAAASELRAADALVAG